VPSATSTPQADALQTALAPPWQQTAADPGASDQTGRSATAAAPAVTPAAPSASLTPMTVLASANPVPPTPLSRDLQSPDQPVANAGAPREADAIVIPLAAQVAVRFAAPVHANDGNTSDSGTDVLFGFAGGGAGGTTAATSSGPAGVLILASFNPGIAMVQPASIPPTTPQHATLASETVPLAGIPIAIVARAEAGEKKFEIRLDPPDLGRIEVQLNVDGSGRVTSHLIVDRADTLDLLRRDAPALERALQSAGLTTGDGALQFSLRDQSFAGRDQWAPATIAAPATAADSDLAPVDTAVRRYGAPLGLGGGIDIRV
jgi:flagellar hook-length control protein FliK